jgi:hypothetical protein
MRGYRAAPWLFGSLWAPDERARPSGVVVPAPPPRELLAREAEGARRWRAGTVEYHGKPRARDDWRAPGMSRLWRYERQYHSEIVALAAMAAAEPAGGWREDAATLVASWSEACPPVAVDAWEPYPVARRVLNWSMAMAIEPSLGVRMAPMLSSQLRFLSSHLERHLRGNHLLCDASALLAGGSLLEGGQAWKEKGAEILAAELARQVLPDGGYAERTAQYHAIVLQDLLVAMALARRSGVTLDDRLTRAAGAMARWLGSVVRVDGTVPYLNDAAPDAMPDVQNVLSLAAAMGLVAGPWDGWLGRCFGRAGPDAAPAGTADLELPDTGWSVVRQGDHELLFEHGPIGPIEQPGHGHSDGLSYELLWSGQGVVLDTGVTTYEAGALRDLERSSLAHASASVAGSPPEELWAAFRVGARSAVSGERVRALGGGGRLFRGSLRAPGGWEHRRAIAFWPGRVLAVFDAIEGAGGRAVTLCVPLAPGLGLVGRRVAGHPAGLSFQAPGASVRVVPGTIGAGFGRAVPRSSIEVAPPASGRSFHAFTAPGCSLALSGTSCTIGMPSGDERLSLDADGLPI